MANKSKQANIPVSETASEAVGVLYLCGTPIGNLDDITFRFIKVLQQVDLVAAEDTRRSIKILNHLEIEKPLISYHEHNKQTTGPKLIDKLLSGKHVALVSDAGMPAISDPGEDLVKLALEAGIQIECVDGPVAAIHALVLSGLSTRRFSFEGFTDRVPKDRRKRFESIQYEDRTMIFYEAPHRLEAFLKDALAVFGDREAVVARELTKRYEELVRKPLSDLVAYYDTVEPKGEFVVLIDGFYGEKPKAENDLDLLTIEEELVRCMAEGLSKKEAIAKTALRRGLPKKEVYSKSIDL